MPTANTLIAGRYEVIPEPIGRGGMQTVYAAKDRSFDRKVALKTPHSESAKRKFLRSAQASASISHPNVASTLDYLSVNGKEYLIEEFVEGENLQIRLDRDFEYLDVHLSCHIIHHVARGVAACHHSNIIHRDLKPSNIMVSSDAGVAMVKITDFGISKMAQAEIETATKGVSDLTASKSSTLLGAFPYMAPEVALHFSSSGKPADVWAVAAIFYHLLFGVPPYGTGVAAVMKANSEAPPYLAPLYSKKVQFKNLFEEAVSLIKLCLQKDPDQRPSIDDIVLKMSQLAYSSAARQYGTIKSVGVPYKGTGFIIRHRETDAFYHNDSFCGHNPIIGQKLSFATFPGNPSPRAHPILPLKSTAQI